MAGERTQKVLVSYRKRYGSGDRSERSAILDEFCKMTGYHRKYATLLLGRRGPEATQAPRRRRGTSYSAQSIRVLESIWSAAGYPWSVRLKALLPLWLPWARKHIAGLTDEIEAELLRISARQIDRRLADKKRALKRRIYGRTKPGTLLKHHIPIRTDNWDIYEPGFSEVDLVSHSGPWASGEFLHSLNLTDIVSGWVETRAVMGKGEAGVVEAIDDIRRSLPFALCGLDSDNGSEFINNHLYRYCKTRRIQFTRGRPYKKDDNAHIEQKNWTHVRRVFGWDRYDTLELRQAMNNLYAKDLRLMMNLFQPSVKLLTKERVGSTLRRRYDAPKTPLDRLVEHYQAAGQALPLKLQRLARLRARLDPFELSQAIDEQLERIHQIRRRGTNQNQSVIAK